MLMMEMADVINMNYLIAVMDILATILEKKK
jgi:hypothetical protein